MNKEFLLKEKELALALQEIKLKEKEPQLSKFSITPAQLRIIEIVTEFWELFSVQYCRATFPSENIR
jgi:hypothetical protein